MLRLDRNLHRSYTYDMLSVRLHEEIEARLQALAKATGRSKSYYVRQAILEKLEEMEDSYLGAAVLERIRKGEERVLSSADTWDGRP
jgi:RHH-type rel operon transcriptional repressor/antitoxin RelB